MERTSIKRGVSLYSERTDKFDTSVFCILLRLPLKRESVTANALIANTFMKGCSRFKTERDIAVRLEELNCIMESSIMKKGEQHIIQLYFKLPTGREEEAFELAGNILFKPLFADAASAKRDLKADIAAAANDKRSYAIQRCIENMCESEPFGINGDGYAEDIEGINIESHYRYVIENADVVIMAVSRLEAGVIKEFIEESLPFEEREGLNYSWEKAASVRERNVEEEAEVVQGKLVMGIRMNIDPVSRNWYRALVANELFGGNANSALFTQAREGESLCYYISSKLLRFKSIMLVEAGIESKNKDRVVDIVNKAIKNVHSENIEMAARGLINSLRSAKDKPERIMDYCLGQIILGGSTDMCEAERCIEEVKSIEGIFDSCVLDTVYMLRARC